MRERVGGEGEGGREGEVGFGGEGGGMEHRSVRTSRRAVTPRTLERPREMRLTKTTMKSKTLLPPPPPPFAPVRTSRSAAHALVCVCVCARGAQPRDPSWQGPATLRLGGAA